MVIGDAAEPIDYRGGRHRCDRVVEKVAPRIIIGFDKTVDSGGPVLIGLEFSGHGNILHDAVDGVAVSAYCSWARMPPSAARISSAKRARRAATTDAIESESSIARGDPAGSGAKTT